MSEITDQELVSIRSEQDIYMPELVGSRLERPSHHDEIDPGVTLLGTNLKVRITSGVGSFRQVADRFQSVNPFTLTFPHGTDVQADDQFYDAAEPQHQYHIKAVRHPGTFTTALQCFAEMIH